MPFIGRILIAITLLCGVGYGQNIRWGQLRTSETSVYNVKTSPFNARGNGTTDDTAAIQAAITAAGAGGMVYLPTGSYLVTDALNMTGKSTKLVGACHRCSVLVIKNASFNHLATGVVNIASGEPGPMLDNITFDFEQPATAAAKANLYTYPPAIYVAGTPSPRFRLRNVTMLMAYDGIDMTGNNGGAVMENLEISHFNKGIIIDGSLDSVQLSNVRFWPYGFPSEATKLAIYTSDPTVIGMEVKRMDDLHMTDVFFITRTAMTISAGTTGNPYITATNLTLDSNSEIVQSEGFFAASNFNASIAIFDKSAYTISGGVARIVNGSFVCGVGIGTSQPYIKQTGGIISISSSWMWSVNLDLSMITSTDGALYVRGNYFNRLPNTVYTKPMIDLSGTVRAIVTENQALDKGTGAGAFISALSSNFQIVKNNIVPGWSFTFPTGLLNGVYEGQEGTATAVQSLPPHWASKAGTLVFTQIDTGGAFAAVDDGTFAFCNDCTVTSAADNTCAGSGTGSLAFRLNGVWRCFNAQN